MDKAQILKTLIIDPINAGACVGGDLWIDEGEGEIIAENPADGEALAAVKTVGKKSYETIISAAQQAFDVWRRAPAPKRGLLIRAIGEELRKYRTELGGLVSLETGKIRQEGIGEVQEMIDMADFAVGLSRQLYGLTMHSERPMHRMYEQWHPLGICGIISAFNFPLAVWSWNAFLAAVCGNVSVWKPSPKTPLTAIAVQRLCDRVLENHGYKGVFNLIIGDDLEIGGHMINDERVPLISFTGSSRVGRTVAQTVASRFGKVILELSGNNAAIVDETADLSLAVPAIVFGAVGAAGQRCTSTRRVLAHRSQYETLKERLVSAYRQIKIGDPLGEDTLMGPLIDDKAIWTYKETIKQVLSEGGRLLYGGKSLPRKGYFVEPTLIAARHDFSAVQSETFAPILYLIPVDDLKQAIDYNNETIYGLSSSLFTDSLQNAEYFLSHLGSDCGIANVNIGTSGAEIGGAFGGEKATGGGRESGSDAWRGYMRRQTNTINWGRTLPLAQGIRFEL